MAPRFPYSYPLCKSTNEGLEPTNCWCSHIFKHTPAHTYNEAPEARGDLSGAIPQSWDRALGLK